MLFFIICINIQSKAQQENQFIAVNSSNTVKPVFLFSPDYSDPGKDYDYYMRKSKRSRNTGLILLGGGVLFSGVGALLSFGDNNKSYSESRVDAGIAMLFTGAAAGIASIPFMAIALGRKNKAKAMMSSQKTGFGVPSNVSKDITGITFSISIGNKFPR